MRQLSQGAYFFQSFPYQPIHWRDAWLSTCSQWFNVILQSTPPGKQVLSESHWILEEVGQESGGQLLVTSYQFWDALVVVVQYVLTLWTQSFCPLTTPSVLEVNHQFSRMVVPFGWRYALNWNMVIRKSTDKGGWTYMARCMCLFFNWEWLRMMYSFTWVCCCTGCIDSPIQLYIRGYFISWELEMDAFSLSLLGKSCEHCRYYRYTPLQSLLFQPVCWWFIVCARKIYTI